ncbi:hypothetical protein COCSUDRAFT_83571 [Coccomyxa subellipsoidea C-169]|uniref:C2 domain-containing protein n=1 Tax=Coccomyxa subellipsoidea (strain C-169) TaxID=574566 RepID=I0Z8P3_COCSC|nr:hypothetical protein COCSUDRAFT_83571 [Coccomyxa subellipsoidea C-169]EIE27012.1 hypothetical protein COCSUDRAFT_83571 [Coccomyxa subellipsoidea C-169]|eukprot:XP_005651556.1 hypothetical protein COCSUDRAFT_83571 [Coccomyxa subellipsoidea C-169]
MIIVFIGPSPDLKVKSGGFRMPKLSPRGTSPKEFKRNTSILKLLRKPKPHWKNMLKGKKSQGTDDGKLSTMDEGEETEGSQPSQSAVVDEGSQIQSHHSMAPGILGQSRDLHVHVLCARGLRAADSNGLSDPYTVVRLGSRSEQTHVLLETLDPDWNEAFVFGAEEVDAAIVDNLPSLLFEVWDSDIGVVADDFLGQVAIQCRDSVTRGTAEEQPLSAISALCPAPGQVEKKLPAVIHDERGNTVYEEPCVAWLHLRIASISQSSLDSDEAPLITKLFTGANTSSRWRSLTGLGRRPLSRQQSSSSTTSVASVRETLEPSPRFKERRNLHRVISESDEGGGGHSGEVGLKSVHRKIKRLFGKVDDEGELMQTTDDFDLDDDESESDENEEQEIEDEQQLYWEVSVGNQTKRSRLAPLQGARAQWGQDFAFAVVLPLRTRPLRLELHQSTGNRRKGIQCR